jgi:hypothetical protein
MQAFRIHGDNIVECERIANIIIQTLNPHKVSTHLISPSTIAIEIQATYSDISFEWRLELLPGFNKNTKKRWEQNIFDALKDAGSFFDETPDAIISEVCGSNEQIKLAIEFCSALQAGNQAWQRSARAFSTGRTGCPYLYIVDFVKYELDNSTRERKNLRFPNAAVPYSYVNYSKTTGNFIAQLYTKSEEFDKSKDPLIASFNDSDFGSEDLGRYMVKLLRGLDTSAEETNILNKNMNVVQFLSKKTSDETNLSAKEWKDIYGLVSEDIVDYSVEKNRFRFHKTISGKSQHGQSSQIIELIDKLSVGLGSRDLPFGIIPANDRPTFANGLALLYPKADSSVINQIAISQKHLIIAIFKGFKPRGDDNRPDRGLLPLASMLSASDTDVLTFIYGPLIEANLNLLDSKPQKLAKQNGLWRSILSLSDFVLLDVPVLGRRKYDATRLYYTSELKSFYNSLGKGKSLVALPTFSSVPVNYGEDDVDTGIHYLFTHILGEHCFEGMCNPPGGDWSGFSVIDNEFENRWLSLPRVSDVVNGKRPDHILELFEVFDKPLLLSIESKEKSVDLEPDVGTKLITYIKELMNYIPSAKKPLLSKSDWTWADSKVDFNHFETMSAAAYLKKYAESSPTVFKKNCEILFIMDPIMTKSKIGWDIEIIPSSRKSKVLKKYILQLYKSSGDKQYMLK